MANRSLIPWKRKLSELGTRRELQDSFLSMREETDRLFEDFFGQPFGLRYFQRFDALGAFSPRVDIVEDDKEIKIIAELPGIDDKDIDVSLSNNVLTIRGKKESRQVEKGSSYYRQERSFGSFQRSIELSGEVEADKIEAVYEKGVLKIGLPKPAQSLSLARRITIKKM